MVCAFVNSKQSVSDRRTPGLGPHEEYLPNAEDRLGELEQCEALYLRAQVVER